MCIVSTECNIINNISSTWLFRYIVRIFFKYVQDLLNTAFEVALGMLFFIMLNFWYVGCCQKIMSLHAESLSPH